MWAPCLVVYDDTRVRHLNGCAFDVFTWGSSSRSGDTRRTVRFYGRSALGWSVCILSRSGRLDPFPLADLVY